MKSLVVVVVVSLVVLFAISSASAKKPGLKIEPLLKPTLDLDLIRAINARHTTWTAGINQKWVNKPLIEVIRMLGTKLGGSKKQLPLKKLPLLTSGLPTSFDWREKSPACVGTIRDQGECGSCWAFGCAEALSDRFCIASNGTNKAILAALDLVTCDDNDDGCNGGDPGSAWDYAQNSGLVLETCAPYLKTIPTCEPQQEPCLTFVSTPACPSACSDGEVWSQSKHFASSAYSVSSEPDQIAQEIMTNGPVEAAFSVYEDFLHYKSGVYQYTNGSYLGGHAVKVVGWGVENGTPYWAIANSWTTYWGDQGYFKILRGADECGIEDDIVAGAPQL